MKIRGATLLVLLLGGPSAWAQPASLVKDIAMSAGPGGPGPQELVIVNGTLFFSAEDPANGRELWRSDGTPQGTRLVRDILPGPGSSVPTWLTDVAGTLFFVAFDGEHGFGLWKSDGTAAGTTLVRGRLPDDWINPNYCVFAKPEQLTAVGNRLFLLTEMVDFDQGLGPWVSDGTEAGTIPPNCYFGQIPHFSSASLLGNAVWGGPYLADLGGTLYFFHDDTGSGSDAVGAELWRSDGTAAGTSIVKDIRPGASGSSPSELTRAGNLLYFYAADWTSGRELWKTDGTDAGTTLVADVCPGSCGVQSTFDDAVRLDWRPGHLADAGGSLFFVASSAPGQSSLWMTDGTSGGTVFVKHITAGPLDWQPRLTAAGGLMYFVGAGPNGTALWRSDGTDVGTFPLIDAPPSGPFDRRSLVAAGAGLFFLEEVDSGANTLLWKTDGSVAGSVLLGSFSRNFPQVAPVALGGSLLFVADDGTNGPALWSSDGTAQGTVMIKDVHPGLCAGPGGSSVPCGSSSPTNASDLNGTLLFTTVLQELWRSDGSGAGTAPVSDLTAGCLQGYCPAPLEPTIASSQLFFGLDRPAATSGLWASDGTGAGTGQILATEKATVPSSLVDGNGPLFFQATAGVNGLWKTDGTPGGTTFVAPFSLGFPVPDPSSLTMVGGTLFMLSGLGPGSTPQLWKSDGTAAGTVLVAELPANPWQMRPAELTAVGDLLFFVAGGANPWEFGLWKSDGTAAGTVPVKVIYARPYDLTAVGGLLYFVGIEDGFLNLELWRSDGTSAGTYEVADIGPEGLPSRPEQLTDLGGGLLIFTANDGVSGREVWRSDGTQSGTFRLRDIAPGSSSSWASDVVAIGNGRALFAASGPEHGRELWITDGTVAGTFRLQDIAPGPGSSNASDMASSGSHFFLAADDGATGSELWALDTAPAPVDLGITMTAAPEPVLTGGTLVYTLTVSNLGTTPATVVRVDDALPAGVSFVSTAPGPPTCLEQAGTVECDFGTLPPAAAVTVSITVTVDLSTGPLSNSASVTSYEADSAPGNNTATADTSVSPADLSVSLQGAPNPATVGSSIVYTMTVTNLGPLPQTYVYLRLPLPAALQFLSSTPGLPTCGLYLGTVYCNFQNLAAGGSATATVTASVGPSTLVTATAGATGYPYFDPQPANDSASVTTTVTGAAASELVHGSVERHDLGAGLGPTADQDFYRIGQSPHASYEVFVDGVSGQLGPAGPELRRLAPDGVTPVQNSVPAGARSSRALRWQNASGSALDNELIRVRSLGCSTECTPADAYRIRAYETTGRIPRFNNGGSQSTILALQNSTSRTLVGTAWFWDGGGALLASHVFTLAPRGTHVLNTASVPGLLGAAGSITITSDAGYGEIQGKAVALEPATGFSFDSPLLARER